MQTLQIESTIESQQHNAPRNTLPLSLVWMSIGCERTASQQSHWHNAIPKHITVGIHIWWAVRVSTLQSEAKSFFQFWSNLLTFEKKYKLLGSYLHDISLQREVILHLVLCEPEPKSTDFIVTICHTMILTPLQYNDVSLYAREMLDPEPISDE